MKSLIFDLHKKLFEGKTSPKQIIIESEKAAKKYSFTNSIITPCFNKNGDYKFDPNKILSCIPYSLKDNITTKGITTTGGSSFLKSYIPPFSASCYEMLSSEGAILVAKDSMDEFGLGGTGNCCFTGKVLHPVDIDEQVGGSTSGGSVNVATGISVFAIGTDTGDSIRRPPSRLGVVGYKPTYGAISRYGVMPYDPSHDTVGIITKYVADTVIVAEKLIKYDSKDMTSTNKITDVKFENLKKSEKIKFAVIKNILNFLSDKQKDEFNLLIDKIQKAGHTVVEVDFNNELLNPDFINLTYRVITYTSAYSCLSNLQGITFGNKVEDENDYYKAVFKNRSDNFGDELKRRLVISEFYMEHPKWQELITAAKKFRCAYQFEVNKILSQADCILLPTLAITNTNAINASKYESWLVLSNFVGTPEITIPFMVDDKKIPWGISVMGKVYDDMKVLNIAYTLEEMIGDKHE